MNKEAIKKIKVHFLFILFFLLPDILFGFWNHNFMVCTSTKTIFILALLALILSMTTKIRYIKIFICCFALLQTVQFLAMAYFGRYLSPFAIELMFTEIDEVWAESLNVVEDLFYVPLFVIIPYYILLKFINKNSNNRFTLRFMHYGLILFLFAFILRANTTSGIHQMLFKQTCFASYNTLNAFGAYFGNILPRTLKEDTNNHVFLPYNVSLQEKSDEPINVIVLFGESVNPKHMSIFGYKRNTTPKLQTRLDSDINFVHKIAVGPAVNTLISLPAFINIQHEPLNYQKRVKKDTLLSKLAKTNGFNSIYIGMQGKENFYKTNVSDFDTILTYEGYEINKKNGYNEETFFADAMKKIDLSKRNFIFIHKRNIHSPHSQGYAHRKEEFEKHDPETLFYDEERVNVYDNGMLYEDYLIDNFLQYFSDNSTNPTYIFYISDHNEVMGINGKWGHNFLGKEMSDVPFIFTMFNTDKQQDKELVARMKKLFHPCASEVAILIAEKLGYNITNPNKDANICFINGTDSMGRGGFIKVTRVEEQNKLEFELVEHH